MPEISITPASKSKRILELDALRALAAINLMLFHFTHVYSVKYGFTNDLGFEFPYGKYGVELFFMLSGLVNAMTLLKKREPGNFLASRFIRIFPSFLLVIGVNLLLLPLSPLREITQVDAGQIAANLTVMPNLLGYQCLEPVTWTLQIEVLFYLILLSFFVSGSLEKPFRPVVAYLALCVAGTVYTDQFAMSYGSTHHASCVWLKDALLLQYFPLFAIGIFLRQLRFTPGNRIGNWAGIVLASLCFHAIDTHRHNPLATILMIGLLWASVHGKVPVLRLRPLAFISGISYSLYLLHNNLGSVFIYHLNHAGVPALWCFFAAIGFTITVSSAATYWGERPISRWLRACWARTQEPIVPPSLKPGVEAGTLKL